MTDTRYLYQYFLEKSREEKKPAPPRPAAKPAKRKGGKKA